MKMDKVSPLHKRLLNSRLAIHLVQCADCADSQLKMFSDYFVRKNHAGVYFLGFVQCKSCFCGIFEYSYHKIHSCY